MRKIYINYKTKGVAILGCLFAVLLLNSNVSFAQYDVSSATFVQEKDIIGQVSNPYGIVFNADGTKLFVAGDATGNSITTFGLSTAYDISTATSNGEKLTLGDANESISPEDIEFKPDGTKVFVVGTSLDLNTFAQEVKVFSFDLSTAYNVSTASSTPNAVFSVDTQEDAARGLALNSDGTKFFIIGKTNDKVIEYNMSTAYDITSATAGNEVAVSGQLGDPESLRFSSDGLKMFILETDFSLQSVTVFSYSLTTAFDISTASHAGASSNLSLDFNSIRPSGITFNSDGSKFFAAGTSSIGAPLWEYSLSAPCTPPTITSTTPNARCDEGTIDLAAVASEGDVKWYDVATGGAALATGTGYTTTTLSSTASYWVEADNSGCVSTTRTEVIATVNTSPTVSLGADVTQCGGTVMLDADNAGATYEWKKGTDVLTDNTQTIEVSTSGTYSVTVTDGNSCTGTDEIVVTINASPTVNLGDDVSQCDGTVMLDAGNTGATYEWKKGTEVLTETTQTIEVSASGTYSVTVTDGNSCTGLDEVVVTINTSPTVNLGDDITQCDGTVNLDAGNSGSTYEWKLGTDVLTETTQTIDVSTSGTYTVTVTDGNGCTATDEKVVTINTSPTVNLGADIAQCDGTVNLDAGNSGSTYEWKLGTDVLTETTQTIDVSTSGTYTVTVTDGNGCTGTDEVVVTINTSPTVNLGDDITQCDGTVNLDAGNSGSTYEWKLGTDVLTETTQTIDVRTSGTYTVTLTNGNSCTATDEIVVTINASPTVSLGDDITQCDGTAVILDAGNAGATYEWKKGSDVLTDNTQTIEVSTSGTYSVTVTDTNGCIGTDEIAITVGSTPTITSTNPDPFCSTETVTLTVTVSSGEVQWYDASSGGNLLFTGTEYSPEFAIGTTSYWVEAIDGDCKSARVEVIVTVNFCYSGGSGTEADPYLISNKTDLKYLSENSSEWAFHFKQIADIAFTTSDFETGGDFYNDGVGFSPIGLVDLDLNTGGLSGIPFSGSYDGDGYFIGGVKIVRTNGAYFTGFFGGLTGKVKNLGVTDVSISGVSYTGAMVGAVTGGIITNSFSSGMVNGHANTGGLVGGTESGGSITNCYSVCIVSGSTNVGGLIGENGIDVSFSYAVGQVNGSGGGLIGSNLTGTVANAFWDTETSGQSTSSGGGEGKTTAEMKTEGTFTAAGWDFVDETANGTDNIWKMDLGCPNNGYPILAWQNTQTRPTITSITSGLRCEAGPVTLMATASAGEVKWFGEETGGHLLFTGTSYTTPDLEPRSNGSFWVEAVDGSCLSATRTEVEVVVREFCYSGGLGTLDDPFLIANKNDLNDMTQTGHLEFDIIHFKQISDIAFTTADFEEGGDFYFNGFFFGFIGRFHGNYDGNRHTIDGLKIININIGSAAWFRTIEQGAMVHDLGLTNVEIFGADAGGGLAVNNFGTINNCYTTGEVRSFRDAAGLVTYNDGTINNSYSMAATNESGQISAGLVTTNIGTISNSYSTGLTNGQGGGLVGSNSGDITNCFWDTETSGQTTSDGGTGKTTAEMKTQSTFADAEWDFVGDAENNVFPTWVMDVAGSGYPILFWQDNPSFTVSGSVTDENSDAFSAGKVNAYNAVKDETRTYTIDATSGEYIMELLEGDYHISVVPDNVEEYFTTYFGDTRLASATTILTVGSNLQGQNIQMIAVSQEDLLDGNGKVTGRVIEGEEGGRIVQGLLMDGTPIAGVPVFLVRTSDDQIMTEVVTDENGDFEITGIPEGEYRLSVEIAGQTMDLAGATFTMGAEGTPFTATAVVGEDGISLMIEVVLSIEETIDVSVYPNPVHGFLTVKAEGQTSIRVVDILGNIIMEGSFINEVTLDVSSLKQGIHLVEIRNNEGRAIRKLIKN